MRKCLSLIALLIFCISVYAQTKTTGRVTDPTGAPVPFATIRVKGMKSGTSADADGKFSINVKPGDIIVISGTGINSKEVHITASTTELNVQAERSTAALTEVVVTALGVERSSKELGYATASLNNKTL